MVEIIGWISLVVHFIAIPTMAVISILFHRQRKTKGSLLMASGFGLIFIGMIVGFIFPQSVETLDEANKMMSAGGPPLRWFFDDIFNSIGAVLMAIGFGLVVVEDKNNV